jgi:curved DNA-binding protein CbpA
MERLDRMFMEAAAARASEEAGPSRTAPVVREAAEGDPVGGGGTVASQILKHIDGGDIFSALVLPRPECDDAGRPVWHVTDSEISKAFRKRSLAVHPDKNPSAEAKQAFDKLNDAVRSLRDPTRKGEALRRFADRAFKEKCRADPTFTERAKKAQERADAVDFSSDILRQQREHRARVEAKRQKAMAFRRRERSPDEESDSSDGSDEKDAAPCARADETDRLETDGDDRLETRSRSRSGRSPRFRLGLRRRRAGAARAREPRRARARARQRPEDHPLASERAMFLSAFRVSRRVY